MPEPVDQSPPGIHTLSESEAFRLTLFNKGLLGKAFGKHKDQVADGEHTRICGITPRGELIWMYEDPKSNDFTGVMVNLIEGQKEPEVIEVSIPYASVFRTRDGMTSYPDHKEDKRLKGLLNLSPEERNKLDQGEQQLVRFYGATGGFYIPPHSPDRLANAKPMRSLDGGESFHLISFPTFQNLVAEGSRMP